MKNQIDTTEELITLPIGYIAPEMTFNGPIESAIERDQVEATQTNPEPEMPDNDYLIEFKTNVSMSTEYFAIDTHLSNLINTFGEEKVKIYVAQKLNMRKVA